ncbi:MAG: M56 family metallopeptidase [Candidatus Sumerlaeia bacterium]|nr:M56 family metallopeptidase [Candidatus Sumerlaeia bacterium]
MTAAPGWLLLWAEWLLRASLQAAALFAVLWAAEPLLRRMPATVRHALWMLVPVKVLLPPALSSPFSLAAPAVQPAEGYAVGLLRLFADPLRAHHGAVGLGPEVGVLSTPLQELGWQPPASAVAVLLAALFAVWAAGVVRMLYLIVKQQLVVSRVVASGRLVESGPLAALLAEAAGRGGPKPRLVLAAIEGSPFLCGLLRPTIVLPAGLPGSLTRDELLAVLRHELEHWRRGDLAWCWLQSAALAPFWFHPLLWLAQERIDEERELAVDAAVSGATLAERAAYARTILAVLEETVAAPARALAFTGAPGARVERRLREAIRPVRAGAAQARGLWAGAALFAAVMLPMNSSLEDPVFATNRAAAVVETRAA